MRRALGPAAEGSLAARAAITHSGPDSSVGLRFTPSHRGGAGPPLVLLHGFLDTWRVWELVLPALERRHDVLALTLAGHTGGPPLPEPLEAGSIADAVEAAMARPASPPPTSPATRSAATWRSSSPPAAAPAASWPSRPPAAGRPGTGPGGGLRPPARAARRTARRRPGRHRPPRTARARRLATQFTTVRYEHIPPELLAHQAAGAARCPGADAALAFAARADWALDAERIACPVRIVWGTADRLLPWPAAAVRYRRDLPHADWVVLDGVGHCPQLDVPLETAELIAGWAG